MIENMAYFHSHVMSVIAPSIPTYVLRYEDLCTKPVDTLRELFEFLLEVPCLKDTVCEARIKLLAERGADSHAVY